MDADDPDATQYDLDDLEDPLVTSFGAQYPDATQYGLDDIEDPLETSFCAQYPAVTGWEAQSVSSYGFSELEDDISEVDVADEEDDEVTGKEESIRGENPPPAKIQSSAGCSITTQDWAELEQGMNNSDRSRRHSQSGKSVDLAGNLMQTHDLPHILTQQQGVSRPPTVQPDAGIAQNIMENTSEQDRRSGATLQTTLDHSDPLESFQRPWVPKCQIPQAKKDYLLPGGAARPGQFWSWDLYRDADGNKPTVHYCKTLGESEACAKLFLHEPIIGFDMEWRPRYQPGIKTNASLIQLASEEHIGLFHIAQHPGKTPRELMAPSLRKVLESPRILKTGVAVINADGKRSKRYFKIEPKGLFELSWLHWQVQPGAVKKLTALAKLTEKYLRLPLSKGPVRCSDWTKPLTPAQVKYSASDAYVGFHLFMEMNNRRLALQEVPPLSTPTDLSLVPLTQTSSMAASSAPRRSQRGGASSNSNASAAKIDGRPTATVTDHPPLPEDDARIYAALIRRHDEMPERDNVPKYGMPLATVLFQVARRKPQSLDQLKQIKGVGNVRISKFGAQWLAVIKSTRTKPNTSEEPLDARAKRTFSALCGLRIQLARKACIDPLTVSPDSVLRSIASDPPRMEDDLLKIDGCKQLSAEAARHGVSLLAFLAKHDAPTQAVAESRTPLKTFSAPQINSLPKVSGQVSPGSGKIISRPPEPEEITDDDDEGFAEPAGASLKRVTRARVMRSPPRRQKTSTKF